MRSAAMESWMRMDFCFDLERGGMVMGGGRVRLLESDADFFELD